MTTDCNRKPKYKPTFDYKLNQKKYLDINEKDRSDLPPLYKTVNFNHLKKVSLLLELGANPNVIYKHEFWIYFSDLQ